VHAVTSPRSAHGFTHQLSWAITRSIFGLASARQGSRYARPATATPACGLAALTGHSVEPENGNYVMARRIRCGKRWRITSPNVDHATIDHCRELLDDDAIRLSDEEADRVRQICSILGGPKQVTHTPL